MTVNPGKEQGFVLSLQRVLPDADHPPAESEQEAVHLPIAGFVASNLRQPKLGVGLGLGRVFWTPMPETTVNKHGKALLGENKIRFARQLGATPPDRDRVRLENLNQT